MPVSTLGYSWPVVAPGPTGTSGLSLGGRLVPISTYQLLGQMQQLFPLSWVAPDVVGQQQSIKTAILQAAAVVLGEVGDGLLIPTPAPNGQLIPLVKQQLRIKTASGSVLDQIAYDFYGKTLARLGTENDTSLLTRILAGLFVVRGTRAAIVKMLTALTGVAPRITEVWRPNEHGAWSATTGNPFASAGKNYYALPATNPGCYFGIDTSYSAVGYSALGGGSPVTPPAFRYTCPGISPDKTNGLSFNGFIDTTYPLSAGAQGNPQKGFATGVPVGYPPSQVETGVISNIAGVNYYGSQLAPPLPTMAGGGFVSASVIATVNGQKTYSTVVGDTTSAFWSSVSLASASLQVMAAIDSFRPEGVSAWVRINPMPTLLAMQAVI